MKIADPPIGLQSADRIGQLGGSVRAINQNVDAAAMGFSGDALGFGGDALGRKQHSGGGSNLVQHDERRTLAHLRGHGVDHAILVGVNGNWRISLIHANDTNRLSSQ